jgi:hypothetical protein
VWLLNALPGLATALTCFVVGAPLPLLILAYYFLRRRLREQIVQAKILELGLEREYLRLCNQPEWAEVRDADAAQIRERFQAAYRRRLEGGSSFRNYLVPWILTGLTGLLFAALVYGPLSRSESTEAFLKENVILFALAGALLYVYPLYVWRYASLSLNPHILLSLLGRLWLSALLGVIISSVTADPMRPLAAFLVLLSPIVLKARLPGHLRLRTLRSRQGSASCDVALDFSRTNCSSSSVRTPRSSVTVKLVASRGCRPDWSPAGTACATMRFEYRSSVGCAAPVGDPGRSLCYPRRVRP